MYDINDSIHQLFSTLLSLSREGKSISFESEYYEAGSGFSLVTEGEVNQYHMSENTGLLGFSHPLKIKSSLMAALEPKPYATKEETLEILSQFESFFSNLIGFNLFINTSVQANKVATAPGRYSEFFNEEDIIALKTQSLNINNLLPFSFSLSQYREVANRQSLTSDHLLYTKSLLRLLSQGQFYSGTKLIAKRSVQLKKRLESLPFVSNVNGLTIQISETLDIKKLRAKNIICDDHLFVLPLFYNDSHIDEVISILQEEFKCL